MQKKFSYLILSYLILSYLILSYLKGLRSPLDTLFTEMLRLEKFNMYTCNTVRDLGVPKTMERIIKQFRASFDQEYLEKKDKECADGKWVCKDMFSLRLNFR